MFFSPLKTNNSIQLRTGISAQTKRCLFLSHGPDWCPLSEFRSPLCIRIQSPTVLYIWQMSPVFGFKLFGWIKLRLDCLLHDVTKDFFNLEETRTVSTVLRTTHHKSTGYMSYLCSKSARMYLHEHCSVIIVM